MKLNTTVCGVLIAALAAGTTLADEWEEQSTYYEDDSWLDITEWFDGNDYNPTDEAWWRWDDERYDAVEDTSGDRDSDFWYGYVGTRAQDDWFYDYYDPNWNYGDWTAGKYDYGWRYYDYDNDGSYDASVWYSDTNGDGVYERYSYYSFNDAGSQQQHKSARTEAPTSSREQAISGTIQNLKEVQTRDVTHTVAKIQTDQGQTMLADLGKSSEVQSLNLKTGSKITLKGPVTKVAEQNVVLARSFQTDGQTHQVNRQRREITGTVLDTKTVSIRGREHLIAMVQGDKNMKMAVDLGPANQLGMNIAKDSKLTFTGVPVKFKDRRIVMAQSVKKNGSFVSIDRRGSASSPMKNTGTSNTK